MIGDKRHKTLAEVARPAARRVNDDPEHRLQCALIEQVRDGVLGVRYPDLLELHAIPNGGKRGWVVSKKMKREGVMRGVPDLFLPVPAKGRLIASWPTPTTGEFHGLYLESKAPGGRLSFDQRHFLNRAVLRGYAAAVYTTVERGVEILTEYITGGWRQEEMFRFQREAGNA